MRRFPRRVFSDSISRREALRFLATASGAALLGPQLTGCGSEHGDGSSNAPLMPEELDIQSVVIVMMENRSFDHFVGSYSLLEGRSVDGLRNGFTNPRPDGSLVASFRSGLRCVDDPPHSWSAGHRQVDNGANDGFVSEYHSRLVNNGIDPALADEAMGYFTRADLPIHYALADEFALCQRWFSAVLGPTWPNRMYLNTAQSNGRMNNDLPPLTVGFTWPTIWDRLNDAGIDWKSYFGDLPFLFLWGRLRAQQNHFGRFEEFLDQARSGTLPAVCHIEPIYQFNSDHPPQDTALGQAFLSSILSSIAEGPQWARTMVILCYDEHGGFFDHVAPPIVADERAADGFGQLGVRVPGIVISPYTKRGYVSSTLHEHSSVPAFLEWLFGLPPLTVRDANANYFLDTFDLRRIRNADPRPFPGLPVIDADPDEPAECFRFTNPDAGDRDLERFADVGGIPSEFDGRKDAPELIRTINRELIAMGKARRRRG